MQRLAFARMQSTRPASIDQPGIQDGAAVTQRKRHPVKRLSHVDGDTEFLCEFTS
jgi:hypothetical protein